LLEFTETSEGSRVMAVSLSVDQCWAKQRDN